MRHMLGETAIYANADVLFLQLNDFDSFKTALPSKLVEYAAMGRPIWADVVGGAATLLQQEVS